MKPERILQVLDSCDVETRIAVVAWAFKHLVEHAQTGGTLRALVYERLGLPLAAYTPLLNAGGMTIVRHFELLGRREPAEETVRVPAEPSDKMVAAINRVIAGSLSDLVEDADEMIREAWADALRAAKLDAEPNPLAADVAIDVF